MSVIGNRAALISCIALIALAIVGGSAQAATPAPGWTIESLAAPTDFSPAQNAACMENIGRLEFPNCDTYTVTATNAGSLSTDGSEIVLTDALSKGLVAQKVALYASSVGRGERDLGESLCSLKPVRCEYPGEAGEYPGELEPDMTLKMIIYVTVEGGPSEQLSNRASVSGGGAPEATAEANNVASSSAASFGLSAFNFYISGPDGKPDTQAGDHPYELTTAIGFNSAFRTIGPQGDGEPTSTSVEDLKDVVIDLPPGFVGSTLAAPECTLTELSSRDHCPSDTVVGHIYSEPVGSASVNSPIYNIVPERGTPAEFGYVDTLKDSHVLYAQVVPTPYGYGLQVTAREIPAVALYHVITTFYGNPAAKQEELARREGVLAARLPSIPFFTNPTECSGGPLTATIHVDSWQRPGTYNSDGTPAIDDGNWVSATSQAPAMENCGALVFDASLVAQPMSHESDEPSGLEFALKTPQVEKSGVVASPTLRKALVTLPEGLTVNPAAATGLAACSEEQIGWLKGSASTFNAAPPACPQASKLGTLELETPLIARKLEGEVFLARQDENPFGTTLAAYIVVNDPTTGVLVKIAGKFRANPVSGQLTAEFDENPNLPFSDLTLHFFDGPRAALATPESCGIFTATAELTPYSAPQSGLPVTPSDSFLIDESCPAGFGPKFTALSTDVEAGAYTPFVASFSRSDTDQEPTGLSVTLPPGLLAKVAGVPLCGEAEIRAAETGAGGCPQASQVGTVETGVGSGPDPLFVSGKAYLTGPYKGGPYGLAVVVPAVAGPYNFGTVVVRQSIHIDPRTAQVTDVSDAFPTIIEGIPLRLRRVDVTLDRPQFAFNPTSCERESFTGAISGASAGAPRELSNTPGSTVGYATQVDATAPIGAPFQVTDCANLKFAPKFAVYTSAKASHTDGASLTVKLSYPNGAWGSQADIHRVKVSLPKQLPSRLKTLQKACTAAQFNSNPSGCPPASIVGHAIVRTPVLPTPLQGPAYFVSNGNEAFPNLIMVLQGDNVTVQLVGDTFISKKGITSSTFNAVPDVPFSSFELTLPKGQYSALAGNLPAPAKNSFCRQSLTMPTIFDAQNGAVVEQTTEVHVSGCPKKRRVGHKSSGGRGHGRKR